VKERLEDVIRDELSDDLVLLLRGGVYEHDLTRIRLQAQDLDRRSTWRGGPSYGVSVFASTPLTEVRVLAEHMDARRRYYRISYRDVAEHLLLSTLQNTHWSVMFDGPAGPQYQLFVGSYAVEDYHAAFERAAPRSA
jgi:hypothetical protein